MKTRFYSVSERKAVEFGYHAEVDLFYCDLIDFNYNRKVSSVSGKTMDDVLENAIDYLFFVDMDVVLFTRMIDVVMEEFKK